MKVIHSWLKEYVGEALPDAATVEELLTFHAFEVEGTERVESEDVIEVKVLPDRAGDCLSHRGIARELCTILGKSMEYDPLREATDLVATDRVQVTVADREACPRFTAAVITGVTVKESPTWLQTRLKALGQRPINNVVDATNYVMFALGQPMHAYDADAFPKMNGAWQLGVRFAKEGEAVSLLAEGGKDKANVEGRGGILGHGDRVVELTGTELLIVEGSSDTPVGLAGIKGGRFAELTAKTTNIIVEAAHFHPATIRKTARRLGINTDASKRFENEPSRELPLYAQRMIVDLILKVAGGSFEGLVDVYPEKQEQPTVTVSVANVNKLLGLSLKAAEVEDIIARTGATVTVTDAGVFAVVPPFERVDLTIEENFIDEVGRIYGLSNVQSVVPEAVPLAEVNKKQYYSEKVRKALLEVGFSEVITSSFQRKGSLQLQNALASDKSFVREMLTKNITAVLDANFTYCDLLGIPDVRVFEIGAVFHKTASGVGENVALTLGARTKGNGYNSKDDAVLKEGQAAAAKALGVELAWETEKGVAELDLSAVLETLPTPIAYDPFEEHPAVTYRKVSSYPAVSRDIALWVAGGEEVSGVAAALTAAAGPLLVRQTLFDTFSKDGRTSYAFRLVFQSFDRTLTDEEVNLIMESVYQAAKKQAWEVR